MKIYNYRTKKLYESNDSFGTIRLSLKEKALSPDVVADEDEIFDENYISGAKAIADAYQIMLNIAKHENIDPNDVDCEEDGEVLVCTCPGYKSWTFTVLRDEDNDEEYEPDDYDDLEDNYAHSSDLDADMFENEDLEECNTNESVSKKFSRYNSVFENDSEDISEKDEDDDIDEKSDDDSDEDKEDKSDEKENDKESDNNSDEDDEEEEMKAVVLTVKKEDADACKEELIDAGVDEDDIEILDGEDDDENAEIRVDVNSVMELKDYLEGKGIDLEEKIGGEIVSDEEDSDEEDDDKESDKDNKSEDDEEVDFNFDDLGDIFGAEDEEEK